MEHSEKTEQRVSLVDLSGVVPDKVLALCWDYEKQLVREAEEMNFKEAFIKWGRWLLSLVEKVPYSRAGDRIGEKLVEALLELPEEQADLVGQALLTRAGSDAHLPAADMRGFLADMAMDVIIGNKRGRMKEPPTHPDDFGEEYRGVLKLGDKYLAVMTDGD